MKRVDKLPPQFKRFAKKGGVLKFAVFEDCDGSDGEILTAIEGVIPDRFDIKLNVLEALGYRKISEHKFYGDWYNHDLGQLLMKGRHTTSNGRTLVDPALKKLDGVRIANGASSLPELGSPGQFAYAFSNPPYGLDGRPSETQTVFEEVRDFILPTGELSVIYDWGSTKLPKVSKFFEAGSEWWGMFLFSIYLPALRKLSIIAGSTTD